MKTAVTVLQEMMVKLGQVPEYECIAQSGPQHSATFEYRCCALGCVVTAAAHSKKEAKQEVARVMLRALAARGHPVPPPYGHPAPGPGPGPGPGHLPRGQPKAGEDGGEAEGEAAGPAGPRSYVALLKDLCEQYRLPGVEYELVGDTGPPHLRHFTVQARAGRLQREASAGTKKAARQLAAQQLYLYLRDSLARLTDDFDEEEALVRAHEKAMERYVEARDEPPWRPHLGQRIADYHLGLLHHVEAEKRARARGLLAGGDRGEALALLEAAVEALGLQAAWSELDAEPAALWLLELAPSAPALALCARSRRAAAAAALRYLRRALPEPEPEPEPAAPAWVA